MTISLQHHLVRERQYYGQLIASGRASPRVVNVGSMLLQLDDITPLPALSFAPLVQERTVMGYHDAEIMK